MPAIFCGSHLSIFNILYSFRQLLLTALSFFMPDFTPQNPKQLWQLPFQNRNEGAWPMAVAFLGSDRRIAAGDRDVRCLFE